MHPESVVRIEVPLSASGERLDRFLSARIKFLSRTRIQSLIESGNVSAGSPLIEPDVRVRRAMTIVVKVPGSVPVDLEPEDIPLDIIHEDSDILVLNKPAGLVVHPAPGHASGTLVHALLHHCPDIGGIGGERRPGIVHRLDKDTSGVMVVAKNERAMNGLSAQFRDGRVRKQYYAIVRGVPPHKGTVDTLIGRNPLSRKKMSTRVTRGRRAITHYELVESLGRHALLAVRIETGRTHQIRVHLAHIGHPVAGDSQYGRMPAGTFPVTVRRQMLHAALLELVHPRTGRTMKFESPLPEDFRHVLNALRGQASPAQGSSVRQRGRLTR